jgi:transcriptional regulator with XRE-family HTH domain
MTQQQLAEQVGIKFQQIQKYETGANRVSSSRLWDISEVMEVPVSFFFEGLAELMATQRARKIFWKIKKP